MNSGDLINDTGRSVNGISYKAWIAATKITKNRLWNIFRTDTIEYPETYDQVIASGVVLKGAKTVVRKVCLIIEHER